MNLFDPVQLCKLLWPQSYFYDKQCEILLSFRCSVVTMVKAGNELGKDWILGRACLAFFISPWSFYGEEHFKAVENRNEMKQLASIRGCRVQDLPEYVLHQRRALNTSVKDDHLNVLWGEIGNAWRTCSIDLSQRFVMVHHEIRFREEAEAKNANSYLTGKVSGSENMEGLTGHHAPYTFAAGDEASGLADAARKALSSWSGREAYIFNPLPCHNSIKEDYQKGDLLKDAA